MHPPFKLTSVLSLKPVGVPILASRMGVASERIHSNGAYSVHDLHVVAYEV